MKRYLDLAEQNLEHVQFSKGALGYLYAAQAALRMGIGEPATTEDAARFVMLSHRLAHGIMAYHWLESVAC